MSTTDRSVPGAGGPADSAASVPGAVQPGRSDRGFEPFLFPGLARQHLSRREVPTARVSVTGGRRWGKTTVAMRARQDWGDRTEWIDRRTPEPHLVVQEWRKKNATPLIIDDYDRIVLGRQGEAFEDELRNVRHDQGPVLMTAAWRPAALQDLWAGSDHPRELYGLLKANWGRLTLAAPAVGPLTRSNDVVYADLVRALEVIRREELAIEPEAEPEALDALRGAPAGLEALAAELHGLVCAPTDRHPALLGAVFNGLAAFVLEGHRPAPLHTLTGPLSASWKDALRAFLDDYLVQTGALLLRSVVHELTQSNPCGLAGVYRLAHGEEPGGATLEELEHTGLVRLVPGEKPRLLGTKIGDLLLRTGKVPPAAGLQLEAAPGHEDEGQLRRGSQAPIRISGRAWRLLRLLWDRKNRPVLREDPDLRALFPTDNALYHAVRDVRQLILREALADILMLENRYGEYMLRLHDAVSTEPGRDPPAA
jgi:hypothetical protein